MIQSPDVFKSPASDTYIIFGEVRCRKEHEEEEGEEEQRGRRSSCRGEGAAADHGGDGAKGRFWRAVRRKLNALGTGKGRKSVLYQKDRQARLLRHR